MHEELFIPSINQLRYAGYHVLAALVSEVPATKEEECRKAKSHCLRAIYDAYDNEINFTLSKINQFREDYKSIQILPTFPEYSQILVEARRAQSLLIKARKSNDARRGYYSDARDVARSLRAAVCAIEDIREELNKVVAQHNHGVLIRWATILVTIVGAGAAVAAAPFWY